MQFFFRLVCRWTANEGRREKKKRWNLLPQELGIYWFHSLNAGYVVTERFYSVKNECWIFLVVPEHVENILIAIYFDTLHWNENVISITAYIEIQNKFIFLYLSHSPFTNDCTLSTVALYTQKTISRCIFANNLKITIQNYMRTYMRW